MRIIHTADWHLGRSLHGQNLIEDQAYILDQFVLLVKEAGADAVIIAGDVFDRSAPPAEAVSLLSGTLTRICHGLKVPTLVISGNHDNPERIGFAQQLLENGRLYMTGPLNPNLQPVVLEDRFGPVYFCPIPFADPAFVRSFTGREDVHDHETAMAVMTAYCLQRVPDGARKVAIAHAFVNGGEESESERPLSALGGAGRVSHQLFAPFHYTALGHLHRPQQVGSDNVYYAGSLLKYSFAEAAHEKGICLVEMDASGAVITRENMALKPKRDLRCIEGCLEGLLQNPVQGRDDYLRVTLHDEGALLDPLGKLRQVYPNILDIQRPAITEPRSDLVGPGDDFRKMTDADLFGSFYQQVVGRDLTREEQGVLNRLLEGFYYHEREVTA